MDRGNPRSIRLRSGTDSQDPMDQRGGTLGISR